MKAAISKNQWKTIPVIKAQEYTANWQKTYPLSAFLFHRNELECIKNQPSSNKIRFYMGLKEVTTNDKETTEEVDMLAVGVTSSGEDITGHKGNSQVYNFPMPCPSTCDQSSPLYFNTSPNNNCTITKYRKPSPTISCIERLQEVSMKEACDWTLAWQEKYDIKSFLFGLDDLIATMEKTKTSRVRIYFGIDEEGHILAIMVGVDLKGMDIITDSLSVNRVSPCSQRSVTFSKECSTMSPLYHSGINDA